MKVNHRQSKYSCVAAMVLAMFVAIIMFSGVAIPAQAQTFNVLYSFEGQSENEGQSPWGLIQGTNGYLYGATWGGGKAGEFDGIFFKMNTSNNDVTMICAFFAAGKCQKGGDPTSPLAMASNGDYYGLDNGGDVFRVTSAGTLKVLTTFDAPGSAPVIQATNGDLYGVNFGGAYDYCYGTCGSIFKLTTVGKATTLYSFCESPQGGVCLDGQHPNLALVQASDGNLYGTTYAGGTDGVNDGYGTIFKITLDGAFTSLYSFPGYTPPSSALIEGPDGYLYGTTATGGTGTYGNGGTFFKTTTSGDVTYLYNFCSLQDCADGSDPQNIYLATDGNFYGTTEFGGTSTGAGLGTVFQITPSGQLTTLVSFDGTNGYGPSTNGSIMQDTSGILYGVMGAGGAGYPNCPGTCGGVIFSLDMGIAPFVETLPSYGKAKAKVKILGTDLTGATSVTFNGTAATFTVASSSEITTTVPEGATTGLVKVVTAGGTTLTSNTVFQVP